MAPESDLHQRVLRHLVATLAYRAAKVLRDVPPQFGQFCLGEGRRSAVHILAHMGDLLTWAIHLANGEYRWAAEGGADWDAEVRRFFAKLGELDARLASGTSLGYSEEVLIQGPLADAITHVGQLALMRGVAGYPIRPESYARAEIVTGRVGADQAPPTKEFDGDASRN